MTISPPWLLAAEEMPAKITAPFLSPFRFWVTRNERTKKTSQLDRGVVRLFCRINVPSLPQDTHTHTLYHENGQARSIQINKKTISGRFLSIVRVSNRRNKTLSITLHAQYIHTHRHTHKSPLQLVCVWFSREKHDGRTDGQGNR